MQGRITTYRACRASASASKRAFRDVTAEQATAQATLAALQSRVARLVDSAALYQSLGG